MNTPNKPVTTSEMHAFHEDKAVRFIGGKTFSHFKEDGTAVFWPNRRERRAHLSVQRYNARKPINDRGRVVSKNRITNAIRNFLINLNKSVV